ncbi:energy transducer TonB [Hymenobacter cellulosivorans]|uniref:Energy transducer TonB n=1 Tax=Hymenobacter cellulosivorans TaxID=2932249 RepID=A0ABY4FB19_9BACT|nr:energy transducer TonB [Hymenobacter cellulosivorans]UOQ53857.1 energy transducer TonB [Hymenobacter cellulosivorans]
MLVLPILNVRLAACPADWQQMTPTAQGRHCQSCNREVVDFTTATQADLAAARTAAPNGHLCGRFRQDQLAAPPRVQLRPKLRRFVVALVLVCGLGMTSGEAWAQVKKAGEATHFEPATELQPKSLEALGLEALQPAPQLSDQRKEPFLGVYVEQMPSYPGGIEGLLAYLRQNLRYPPDSTVSGKVFVSFVVTKTGAVADAKVIKGLGPAFDAEALRLVQQMPAWEPARQNQQPVAVAYTLPIRFGPELPREPTAKEARRQARAQRRIQ